MTKELTLCYGLVFEPGELASLMGITAAKALKCVYCDFGVSKGFNFCPNCGQALDIPVHDIPAMEVMELVLSTGGKPPTGMAVFCAGNRVCICHVIGSGSEVAMMKRAPEAFPWKALSDTAKSYLSMLCTKWEARPGEWEPTLFCVET